MSDNRIDPGIMQAVFLEKPGGQLVVREVRIPNPGPNEVLIKMRAAPVNPSDLARIRNAPADHDLSTFIPGLEGCGTVVATGKGILPRLWLGKRVACSAEYHTSGSWSEFMVTKAGKCFPLGSKVSDEQGSMSLVNPMTALAFFEIAKKKKHKAIINNAAASALGRMVELLGKKHRIPVINIVRNQKQVESLLQLGSKYVLDSSQQSFIKDPGSISHDLEATLLFDSVCSKQLEQMCDALPNGSSVIIYGNLSGEEQIRIKPRTLIANNINISGFYLGNRSKENGMFRNMMNLRKVNDLMSNEMKIIVQGRFALTEVQEAIDTYMRNMSAGKVLLVMGRTYKTCKSRSSCKTFMSLWLMANDYFAVFPNRVHTCPGMSCRRSF
jgi:NADPH:quinone reductase